MSPGTGHFSRVEKCVCVRVCVHIQAETTLHGEVELNVHGRHARALLSQCHSAFR